MTFYIHAASFVVNEKMESHEIELQMYLKIGQRNIQGLCSLFLYWYVVTFLIDMRKKKVYGAVMYFSSILEP